ncbi:AAA family ATPase [Flavobacteriaceae bacterium F08102]|nr:AAA family ATPase [Flavobacteriaceae bacterium F08102]
MQQEKALAILKSGANVFLTGSAGTGKTYVLNEYIDYLKARKIPVAVTASTGIAATHMNGMTIHSWAGIGVKEHLTSAQLAGMKAKKYLKKHLENTKILIIDEISMLHKNQFCLVNTVLQYFKENNAPFGGIQVIVCGDFFQLPPIGHRGELSKDKFAFMADEWVAADFKICYLTKQYRQSENSLNKILNQIRSKDIHSSSYEILKNAQKPISSQQNITKLFTHNIDVDRINAAHLQQLSGRTKTFKASTKGNKKLIDTLKNSVLANEKLVLKKEAKVMFVRNNVEKGYVNGTLGEVVNFSSEGFPMVKISNGRIITVEQENWSIQDDHGKSLASFTQFPLRLAWAITVHKCQGMTLEAAEIDLQKTFEKGQGYVALSRLKNIENLHLVGFNERALEVDNLAYKADLRFKELSAKADKELKLVELERSAKRFVTYCGGLTSTDEITKQAKKKKEKKSKISTYDITLTYLRAQKSLEEIAEIRGLNVGTIAGHLIKIIKDHPKEDLDFYKPDDEIVEKVSAAYAKQKDGNTVSLTKIHRALNGKVSYDDIKLAIAFI